MGRAALLIVIGLTVIVSSMLISANEQKFLLTQKTARYYEGIISRINAASGANVALSNLLDDPTWRAGIDTSGLNSGTLNVTLTDVGNNVRIDSRGSYFGVQKLIRVLTRYRPPLENFAIFTTGDVTNVITLDEDSDPDTTLLRENEEDLYDIENQTLIDAATTQGHLESAGVFTPADGYPNGDFYYSGSTPNVTHVLGDLRVTGNLTIYGIFVVEGDIIMDGNSAVEGVLYLMNTNSSVTYGGGSIYSPSITGGIIAYGDIDGTGSTIIVQHDPDYMEIFSDYGGDTDASIIVRSWKEVSN